MTYLLLTVFLNVLIFALFKLFAKYDIDNLQTIVVNYFVCVISGSVFIGDVPFSKENFSQPWMGWSLFMGAMFILVFNLIAFSIKKSGITITTISNKLSLVIPVLFSFFLYQEDVTFLKIAGIIIAFPAVFFTSKAAEKTKTTNLWLPVLLFIASGLLDTLVKFVEHYYLQDPNMQSVYLIHVFFIAGLLGMLLVMYLAKTGKIRLQAKNIVAGIILGVPNYFSIYFFVRLLNSGFLQSSAAIPINNIGIVLLSTIVATLFFKEKLTLQKIIGLLLSVASILFLFFADRK